MCTEENKEDQEIIENAVVKFLCGKIAREMTAYENNVGKTKSLKEKGRRLLSRLKKNLPHTPEWALRYEKIFRED